MLIIIIPQVNPMMNIYKYIILARRQFTVNNNSIMGKRLVFIGVERETYLWYIFPFLRFRIVLAIYSLSRSFLVSASVSPLDEFQEKIVLYTGAELEEIAGTFRNSLNS